MPSVVCLNVIEKLRKWLDPSPIVAAAPPPQKKLYYFGGRDSSVGIAIRYEPDGPGIESRWGEIFRTRPDRPWDPPSILYNEYRVCPGVNAAGRGRWPPTPSSAEVKGREELYLYSSFGLSWPVIGWNLLYSIISLQETCASRSVATLLYGVRKNLCDNSPHILEFWNRNTNLSMRSLIRHWNVTAVYVTALCPCAVTVT